MSDLLKSKAAAWPSRPLGELFRISGDQILPMAYPMAEFEHYSIPAWDATGGAAIELGVQIESNKTAITRPSVLVSKLNPRKPRVVAVPSPVERTCCSTEFICYQPKQSNEELSFWADYFASADFSARLARVAVGSTNSHTRAAPKETLKWFVPEVPLTEQRKIAQVFDTLDNAIHETEAIIAKLRAVKQGLLHDLLTRGIDANGELRPPQAEAPHLYKASPLGWIPKEWTTPTFDELESRPTLGLPIRGASADLQNVGLLKMGNLSANNEVDLKSVEPIARDCVADIGKFKLEDGDLLFNTRNTPELVGKTCSWREVPGSEYVFDNNILRARIPRKLGTGHYFADYLGNEIGRRRLLRLATGTTSVAAIYWKDLSEFRMPAPPVCEQFAIHERIHSIDTNRKTAEEAANALLGVKAGLMDDLLTGLVRVTQLLTEATQEPGSA